MRGLNAPLIRWNMHWGCGVAPIYVKHEIVHNVMFVDGLRAKGAIFVEDVSEVAGRGRLIYSAHGVSPTVPRRGKSAQPTSNRCHLRPCHARALGI